MASIHISVSRRDYDEEKFLVTRLWEIKREHIEELYFRNIYGFRK